MSAPTKAERDELRRLSESDKIVVGFGDDEAVASALDALPGLLDYIDALEADLAEVRRGYCQLDKNWHAVHESAMKAIREAVGNSEATVPEIVDVISDSKQRIDALEAETDSLGVTADDEAEAHQETLFLLENAKHRIEALEAALRPFAAMADKHAEAAKYMECPEKGDDARVVVPLGDCRHAREVVKEKA